MAQIKKMERQLEIKSPADKFYDVFKNKLQQMPKICSQMISDVKLVQGDWNSVGTVIQWSYVANGKSEMFKEETLDVDEKSRTIAFRGLEGEVLNTYKSWKATLSVTPKGEGSLVKWSVEYGMENESVPEPVVYLDFLTVWAKTVDAYLLNA